ncbi:hypothetical protein K432DRAFT_377187, partial [Lepidopterella palustris CBS 459.81]
MAVQYGGFDGPAIVRDGGFGGLGIDPHRQRGNFMVPGGMGVMRPSGYAGFGYVERTIGGKGGLTREERPRGRVGIQPDGFDPPYRQRQNAVMRPRTARGDARF